jgi:hypothetical protein
MKNVESPMSQNTMDLHSLLTGIASVHYKLKYLSLKGIYLPVVRNSVYADSSLSWFSSDPSDMASYS